MQVSCGEGVYQLPGSHASEREMGGEGGAGMVHRAKVWKGQGWEVNQMGPSLLG